VWFGAQHADTRAAIQDALPRLREMFAASGMQLADAGVSREAPRQNPAVADPRAAASAARDGAGEEGVDLRSIRAVRHAGLLDTYA
jgi:flagellar hook-length control protein FliK